MNISQKDTKILCTIGPASGNTKMLRDMIKNGMNATRINTAHGTIEEYTKLVRKIRRINNIPVIIDIKGPELRIKCDKEYVLKKGEKIEIYGKENKKSNTKEQNNNITFSYDITSKLKKGDKILIEDGKYSLSVVRGGEKSIIARANDNITIKPDKNVNIPQKRLGLPSLRKKDIECIKISKKENIDYIALSFCRSKQDILNLRKYLKGTDIKIIAKIENHEGIDNIDEIINESDGIMVARGDLGVDLSPEKLPLVQKDIIKKCNYHGKLVIVATQMLESMIENSTPTRAEMSDVANAVLDGADCLMLSAETAIGKYPDKAVGFMTKVAIETEPAVKPNASWKNSICKPGSISYSIANSVNELCRRIPITKIVCLTYSGHTAIQIARFRIDLPIIAVTSSPRVNRQLMLFYGVQPIYNKTSFKDPSSVDIISKLYNSEKLNDKDLIIFTAGLHTLRNKRTNTIQVHDIKDIMGYAKEKKKKK